MKKTNTFAAVGVLILLHAHVLAPDAWGKNGKRPASSESQAAGMVLEFPSVSVGKLNVKRIAANPDDDKEVFSCAALGLVKVPPGCAVDLHINYQGSVETSYLRKLPPNMVRRFDCGSLELQDKAIKDIALLTGLVDLDLEDADMTDVGARHLESLTEMRRLNIGDTLITAKSLPFLSSMKRLKFLRLSRGKLGDDIGPFLSPLTSLEGLDLCGTHISDKTVPYLAQLSRLRDLNLRRNNITNRAVGSIIKLKMLKRLDLTDTKITANGLIKLASLPQLTALVVRRHAMSERELSQLKRALPNVTIEEGSREVDLPRELFAPLR